MLLPAVALFATACHLYVLPTRMVADPKGTFLYVLGGDNFGVIRVVDARQRRTVASIPVSGATGSLAIHPYTDQLYVAGTNGVSILDTASQQVLAEVAIGANVEALAVDSTGTKLLVLHGHPDGVSIVATRTYRVVKTLQLQTQEPEGSDTTVVRAMAIVPGSDLFYLADGATLSLVSMETLSVIATVALDLVPTTLAVDPSGTRLYVAGWAGSPESPSGRLLVLETGAHRRVVSYEVGGLPLAVSVDPAGRRVYVLTGTDEAGTLTAFGPSGLRRFATVNIGGEPVAVTIDPSGTEVYVALGDGSILVVDGLRGTVIGRIRP